MDAFNVGFHVGGVRECGLAVRTFIGPISRVTALVHFKLMTLLETFRTVWALEFNVLRVRIFVLIPLRVVCEFQTTITAFQIIRIVLQRDRCHCMTHPVFSEEAFVAE